MLTITIVEHDPRSEYHPVAGRQIVSTNAIASVLSAISFTVCIVLLAVSRARWATFKRIFRAWIVVFFSGIAVALGVGPLIKRHLLAEILGSMSVGMASVVAVALGIRRVRKANRSNEEHAPLAISPDSTPTPQ